MLASPAPASVIWQAPAGQVEPGGQSLSVTQDPHVSRNESQPGMAAGQSRYVRQPAHDASMQNGKPVPSARHWLSVVHCTQVLVLLQ